MGCWSVSCGISNIAITAGNKCVILPLKIAKNNEYLPYLPATLPIFGEYNDYGGIEEGSIEEDTNTKLIEEHFGISIYEFVEFLVDGKFTYGREEVVPIKEKAKNLKEMEEWRFMWIDRQVYDFMANNVGDIYGGAGHLDYGDKRILNLLGFEYIKTDKTLERYNQIWKFDEKEFFSDGTWLNVGKNGSIYHFNKDEYNNGLGNYITIPEDKEWIGKKAMWQLWKYLEPKKRKELLFWILDGSRYDDGNEEFKELLVKITGNSYIKPGPKTLLEKYKKDVEIFGDRVAELVTIRFNLHPMSGQFSPHTLYLTPQCGEYKAHQVTLDKFAEINRSYIQEDDDE